MAELGTTLVLVGGSATFVNQWYQTRSLDWKVPLATVILAAGVEALGHVDQRGATIMGILVLLGAATTKFNGKSVIDTVTELTQKTATPKKKGKP